MRIDVVTRDGPITGRSGEGHVAFLGVPYAAAPFGENAFRPPQRPEPWTEPRAATRYGAVVPQIPLMGYFGDVCGPKHPAGADCLNVNIWTPDPDASGLPVFVWFHGGGYFACSNTDAVYEGASFARNGVVVVTVNYRLGALGYLHLPELEDADNLGLRDQVAALEWVRDNIAAFGGDPAQVTIGGESAGGMSCQMLMACPRAQGLFHRAVLQSAGVPNGFSAEEAGRITDAMFQRLNIAAGDVEALRAAPVDALLQAHGELALHIMESRDLSAYGPKPVAGNMAFQPVHGTPSLPKPPQQAIAEGAGAALDVLMGVTRHEFSVVMAANGGLFTPDVQGDLDVVFGGDGRPALDAYRRAHPGLSEYQLAVRVLSDKTFTAISYACADRLAQSGARVWFYSFDWETPQLDGALGAHHFLEVPFVFNQLDNAQADALIGPEKPRALAEAVHGAWVAFVKTGDPNQGGLPVWPAYEPETRPTLQINAESDVASDPYDRAVLAVWDNSALL